MLTISTVNVNGLRAAAKKGFLEWLSLTSADAVCLQEVRAEIAELPITLSRPPGWNAHYAPSNIKGRSGVAILTRQQPESVQIGFGEAEFDKSGRYIEIELPELIVGSLYLPGGEVGTPRQAEKERFMTSFFRYLIELRDKAQANGCEVLICGDWNIAHQPADLKAWRANQKYSGFLPMERAWLGTVFDQAGYVDVVRKLNPGIAGPYTFWSYRGKAFDNDAGWRIDYHVATPGLAARAVSARTERAASYAMRWSDHAPVTVDFDWPKVKNQGQS